MVIYVCLLGVVLLLCTMYCVLCVLQYGRTALLSTASLNQSINQSINQLQHYSCNQRIIISLSLIQLCSVTGSIACRDEK